MPATTAPPTDGATLPTLATPRLALRWLRPADVPALHAVFGDPVVCRYWSRPALPDEAAAATLLAEIGERFRRRDLFQWGIARLEDDAVIGTCALSALSFEHRRAEVGYALARAHWGRGYAREALAALIGHAFGALGLHRLEADVDPRNAASIRALEGLGFRREGLLRERYLMQGELQDALLFGLLRPEWDAGRSPSTTHAP